MKLLAIKYKAPRDCACVNVDMPQPKDGEALIRVRAAGICGSDIGAFRGTNPLVSYPRIIGHEVAGEVIQVPENSKGIRPGDHVIVDPYLYCGNCYPCSIGRTNCCTDLNVLGVHVDGGLCEYFTHPADMLWKIPEDMPWELVPITEPLTIALHGIHRGKLAAGEHVAIVGGGPIGLLAAMAAKSYKAHPILIDILDERLEFAQRLGVEHTIQSKEENVEERIREYTGGRMCELVMECSGSNEAIRQTLNYVSNAGRITLTGWPKDETGIPTDVITKKEVDISGARTSAGEFEEAINLIYSGKVDAGKILTRLVSIKEVPETIAEIEEDPGKFLKVNVIFQE